MGHEELLVGTAQEILTNGGLGALQNFAIAAVVTPEPAGLTYSFSASQRLRTARFFSLTAKTVTT
jgi:hypothetical protein